MFTVIPECTFVNEVIAANDIGGFKGIIVAQDCPCLPWSAKCISHRCALESRQWIYVNLLAISFWEGWGPWACRDTQDAGTQTELQT